MSHVEIVEIHLASGLEFVEVIEEAECKHCARLPSCCRKPVNVEKLEARGDIRFSAVAVLDADSSHARDVKESKLKGAGWHRTKFSLTVAKLVGGAEVE